MTQRDNRNVDASPRPAAAHIKTDRTAFKMGRRAGGALVSQFVVAGGSLALQVLAARNLGAAGYGVFAILLGIVITTNAILTGWVGDSLTVLDRFEARVRAGLLTSQLLGVSVAVAAAITASLALGLMPLSGALLFGLVVALWITEELGRRLFMARREFWHLAANDVCYVTAALASLGLWAFLENQLTLVSFLSAMAVGSTVAIVLATVQLPTTEFKPATVSWSGFREVSRFAAWRSAQLGLKPLLLLVVRVAVATFTSRAVLGSIEAARLLLAPATTFVAGVGSFLLSHYSSDADHRPRTQPAVICKTIAVLLLVVIVMGTAAVLLLEPLTGLLTQSRFPIDGGVVWGWTAYAAAFAAGVPPALALVALRASRDVFILRLVDSLIALVGVVTVLALGLPDLVPWALAVGGAAGAGLLCVRLFREARSAP